MSKSDDVLKRFVTARSKFFSLRDGEEAKVQFIKAEEVPNHFDSGKTSVIRYYLKKDDVELQWDRYSRQLAKEMANFSEGDWISIKREGEKSQTRYIVKKAE